MFESLVNFAVTGTVSALIFTGFYLHVSHAKQKEAIVKNGERW